MSLRILDIANEDALVTTWNEINHIYIVLDFNPKGERGNDADRDIIKFGSPQNTYKIDKIPENIITLGQKSLNDIKLQIKNKFHKNFPDKPGEDTLTSIGWKGIYAMDIEDAYKQLKDFLEDRKVRTIVLNTHGGWTQDEDTGEIIIGVFVDNNWEYLPDNEKNNKGINYISSTYLQIYLNDRNDIAFSEQGLPSEKVYIETLANIIDCIEDGKDFVMASCFSALSPVFLSPLQLITGSRINMYGVYQLSSFAMSFEQQVTYTIKRDGNDIQVDAKTENKKNGIAYVTKEKFSDQTLLNPLDIEGKPTQNYAYRFPVGWSEGATPDKSIKLKLNKNGVNF